MLPFETLAAMAAASFLLALAPGPDNIFVLTQSALNGRRAGLLITIGLCIGLVFHTTAVALGMAVIFQTSPVAFNALKLCGAGYLLYLAWQTFKARKKPIAEGASCGSCETWPLIRRGVIMNITNPKVSIFFLAFLPQFTRPDAGPMVLQMFTLGGVFIAVGFVVFATIAQLSSLIGGWLKRSPTAQKHLNWMAAIVFALLAFKLLSSDI